MFGARAALAEPCDTDSYSQKHARSLTVAHTCVGLVSSGVLLTLIETVSKILLISVKYNDKKA